MFTECRWMEAIKKQCFMIMVAMDWTLITGDSLVMVHLCSIIRMSGLKIITRGAVPTTRFDKPETELTSMFRDSYRAAR